jgi:hypothetical protein
VTTDGRRIPVETRISHGVWDGVPCLFGVTKDLTDIQASQELFAKSFQ